MRVFIAIDLPEQIKQNLLAKAQTLAKIGASPIPKEQYHLTLLFLGEIDEQKIEAAKQSLKELKPSKFDISIEGMGVFTPKFLKVAFANVTDGAKQCKEINSALAKVLSEKGFLIKQEEYHAHITLARVKTDRHKNEIIKNAQEDKTIFGKFGANSIKMISSSLSSQGPQYSTLYELEL